MSTWKLAFQKASKQGIITISTEMNIHMPVSLKTGLCDKKAFYIWCFYKEDWEVLFNYFKNPTWNLLLEVQYIYPVHGWISMYYSEFVAH